MLVGMFILSICPSAVLCQLFPGHTAAACWVVDLVKQKFIDLIKKQCLVNAVMEDCLVITWDKKND